MFEPRRKMIYFLLLGASLILTMAQQFPANPLPLAYPGLSAACIAALNTTVTCHPLLVKAAPKYVKMLETGTECI